MAGVPELEPTAELLFKENPPEVAAGAGCVEADDAGRLGLRKLNEAGADEVGVVEGLPKSVDPDVGALVDSEV